MESRMNDIYSVRTNVLTECEKMFQYINIIKNKTDKIVDYIKQLNNPDFLKQYAPLYKYLHEINEKLVEHNCQFELFFLESKNSPSLNTNEIHSSNNSNVPRLSDVNLLTFNDNLLESTFGTEAYLSTIKEECNPKIITKNNFHPSINTSENILNKSTNIPDEIEQDCVDELKCHSSKNSESFNKQVCINSTESINCIPDDNAGIINIENLMEKLTKRTHEIEEESKTQIPDLRPVVIVNDYYESTSESEHSVSELCGLNQNLQSYSQVYQNSSKTENVKTSKDTSKNIEIKPCPIPKEGDLCYISHVESPSSFYIQIVSENNTLIDYLSDQIQEVLPCLKLFQTKIEAKQKIGEYCVCSVGNTNAWYRAKILSWLMENEEVISVQLIDYGNPCFVPLRNIREGIPYFFALHIMAIRCTLAWVKPPKNADEWPNKSIEYFRNLLCSTDESLYYISYVQQNRYINKLCIDLQTKEIISLAGDLISNGMAMDNSGNDVDEDGDNNWSNNFFKHQIIHSQGFSEDELKLTENEKLQQDLEFDDDEEHNDPTSAVAYYNPKDEKEICRIFLAKGFCFKGSSCKFSHTPLNPDGWTTDKETVFIEAFNKLALPEKGEITVKVISIVDLRTYYVIIKDLPQMTASITQPINNMKCLVEFMNKPAEIKKYKALQVKPAYGELLLVKYVDGKWQRGKVLECYEYCNRVELDVFLVDFGTILERVNMKDVREIHKKHLYLPFQTVLCCLANTKMKHNLTEEEKDMGSDYLELNVVNKTLKATVIYNLSYLNVILYNEKGNDIGEELIKAEIVDRCSYLISSNSSNLSFLD